MSRPADLSPTLIAELHEHFSDEQLLELTLDVMKWNYQKVSVALGVDVEVRPGELTDLLFDADGNWVPPGVTASGGRVSGEGTCALTLTSPGHREVPARVHLAEAARTQAGGGAVGQADPRAARRARPG